ncbi:MAG: hypothetical protein NTV86_04790 [Planctomycetota bacterium]|nr:hypothetical protein [Planctomycetota bacterium]
MERTMGKKRLSYDDDELVELIAEGQLTYGAIGERLGISGELVRKIAQGRRRKDLARRLWEAEEGILSEARRIGTRYARNLIMEQVRLGLTGEGEPARRAREFVLKFTLMARPRRKDLPEDRQRRPEWMLQDCRDVGITPWEDELDAQREAEAEEEATERLTAENAENAETEEAREGQRKGEDVATAVGSMAAQAVLPAGVTTAGRTRQVPDTYPPSTP